ncbi:hypothetical protein, partial [Proteus terrae]|uniref:hypothetical protein n=1 Tax=Proteus terrae TaxID=1574161 RepID=UPI0034E5213E
MNTKKMTPDEIIEYLKEKGFPASLLDKEAMKSNRKLTPEEQKIFVKYIVDNLRTLEANKWSRIQRVDDISNVILSLNESPNDLV